MFPNVRDAFARVRSPAPDAAILLEDSDEEEAGGNAAGRSAAAPSEAVGGGAGGGSDEEAAAVGSPSPLPGRGGRRRRGRGGAGQDSSYAALPRAGAVAASDDEGDDSRAELDPELEAKRQAGLREFEELEQMLHEAQHDEAGLEEEREVVELDDDSEYEGEGEATEVDVVAEVMAEPVSADRPKLKLKVQISATEKIDVTVYADKPLSKLCRKVAEAAGWGNCTLMFDGDQIQPTDTPQMHDMEDGDMLDARVA